MTMPEDGTARGLRRFRRLTAGAFLAACLVFGVLGGLVFQGLGDLSGVRFLEDYAPPVPTRLLDVKGRLIARFFTEKRELIGWNEVPPALVEAVIATEDEHFESHFGFNPWRILKAAAVNTVRRRAEQGGSTITVQLSKVLFFGHKKTLRRKVLELWYAFQIERLYTKQEILLFYFNQIYYGHGCYGVESAARFYFGKHARELDTAECALLAGIPRSPALYSPLTNPKSSRARQQLVFKNLVRHGRIARDEAPGLADEFWMKFNARLRSPDQKAQDLEETQAPYFVEFVRKKLEDSLDRDQLYKGGLVVYTTLDLDSQRAAEAALAKRLEIQNARFNAEQEPLMRLAEDRIPDAAQAMLNSFFFPYQTARTRRQIRAERAMFLEGREPLRSLALLFGMPALWNALQYSQPSPGSAGAMEGEKCQGAVFAIEPSTGYINAMVGGSGFKYQNQFNHVLLARRQIGSAIKPFIYAAALERRLITPATIFDDAPIAYGEAGSNATAELYVPQNYDGDHLGKIPVREALRRSVNTVALQVLDRVTPEKVREWAKTVFPIRTDKDLYERFPRDVTMGLGSGSFTPWEITLAYAMFANGGREVVPIAVRYVTDRRGVLVKNFEAEALQKPRRQMLDPGVAYLLADMLRGVFEQGGTAPIAEMDGFAHRFWSAGKTGTTGNWTDAWFIGFTRHLCASVWLGYDSNKSLGRDSTGGKTAAPIWAEFMKEALATRKVQPFAMPSDVVAVRVSRSTGKLEGPRTRDGVQEIFLRGTEPEDVDDGARGEAQDRSRFMGRFQKPAAKKKNADVQEFLNSVK